MMLIQNFQVDDFQYQVRLMHDQLSFALLNRPRRLRQHDKDAWLYFLDDDHYEDVDFHVPMWRVLRHVVGIVKGWLRRYGISYFCFYASTIRKIKVYERLLQRYLPPEYGYQMQDNGFYVYRIQD